MTGKSLDLFQHNLEQLKALFPQVFTEGKLDLEKFKATFTNDINIHNERYVLNWAGKGDAFRAMQVPATGTLMPQPEESVNFDEAENIFIEGENLEVLKLLQKSYYGKIKCIIIDPPYNTGNDSFIYPDSFKESRTEYEKRIGDRNEEGQWMKEGLFRKNSKDSGHYHSNWLSMMYPRLFLARNLLTDDGVIFVHIDDNEVHNLRLLMNEVFGEENLLGNFVWRTDGNFDNQAKVKNCHEYILAYCKQLNEFPSPPTIDPSVKPNSKLFKDQIRNTIVKNGPANPISDILLPIGFPAEFENGTIHERNKSWPHYKSDAVIINYQLSNETIVSSGWSSKELITEFINNGLHPIQDSKGQETSFIITQTGSIEVIKKRKAEQSHVISVITGVGNTQSTSATLKKEGIEFDYPKPINLIKYLASMNAGSDFIVLDFFAGSGTTAESIIELNKERSQNNKFILVQLPEVLDDQQNGKEHKTISKLARERVKKVVNRNNTELFQRIGFKSFKLTDSNFKIWQGNQVDKNNIESQLALFTNPLTENHTPLGVVYEIMLKAGMPLTAKLTKQLLEDGRWWHSVGVNELAIAIDTASAEMVSGILQSRPQRVIMLDECFKNNDQLKTNTVLQMRDAGVEFKTI